MVTKYQFKFKINEVINKDNDYDLFIFTVLFALNDLYNANKMIHLQASEPNDQNSFFFRINMGFVSEAYKLLKSKFIDNPDFKNKYLVSINGAIERFEEIQQIVSGNTEHKTFMEQKININRNIIFHYPYEKGYRNQIQNVLTKFEVNGREFVYNETDDYDFYNKQNFGFIDILQFSLLYGVDEISDEDSFMELMDDLAILTGKVYNLLTFLWQDFLLKKNWKPVN